MRILLILFLLLAVSARALPQSAPIPGDCAVDGKGWDLLLQDFIDNWKTPHAEFCEFKRFIAMNTMVNSDMRLDAKAYEAKLTSLEKYGDQLEAVNYLMVAFQETWFHLFIDASLDREYERGKTRWTVTGVGMGSLAAFAVALPFTRAFSSKSLRFLRGFVTSYFSKRPVVFGLTSTARGSSHLSFGAKPEIVTGFVRPPLLNLDGDISDLRTRDVFVNEFWEDVYSAGLGVGTGWVAGHYTSLGVKHFMPKWAHVFEHGLASTKILDIFSPGVVAGAAVTYVVTDFVAQTATRTQFRDRIENAKLGLTSLAHKTNEAVAHNDEYRVWLNGEQLKNGLMLQNYLLTRGFKQALVDEQERSMRVLLAKFADCETSRAKLIAGEREAFRRRIAKLIKSERNNLDAALDITQEVEGILLDRRHPMTDPLVGSGNELIESDKWFLNEEQITADMFADVEAAVVEAKVDCAPPDMGVYP